MRCYQKYVVIAKERLLDTVVGSHIVDATVSDNIHDVVMCYLSNYYWQDIVSLHQFEIWEYNQKKRKLTKLILPSLPHKILDNDSERGQKIMLGKFLRKHGIQIKKQTHYTIKNERNYIVSFHPSGETTDTKTLGLSLT